MTEPYEHAHDETQPSSPDSGAHQASVAVVSPAEPAGAPTSGLERLRALTRGEGAPAGAAPAHQTAAPEVDLVAPSGAEVHVVDPDEPALPEVTPSGQEVGEAVHHGADAVATSDGPAGSVDTSDADALAGTPPASSAVEPAAEASAGVTGSDLPDVPVAEAATVQPEVVEPVEPVALTKTGTTTADAVGEATPVEPSTEKSPYAAPASVPAPRRGAGVVAWVLAGLLVVATGVMTFLYVDQTRRHADLARDNRLRATATASARTYAAEFSTFDYQNFSQQFAQLKMIATPDFQSKLTNLETVIGQTLTSTMGKSTGTVREAAVSTFSPQAADVLVFVDQETTNSQLTTPRLDQYRLLVHLQRSGSTWLVRDIQVV